MPATDQGFFGPASVSWKVHRETTAAKVASNLKNHVYPTFEGRALGSIRPSEVQAWVKGLSDKLAPALDTPPDTATSGAPDSVK